MVLQYINKNNIILLDGFARVYTVSANFPDNPRTLCTNEILLKVTSIHCGKFHQYTTNTKH